MKNIIFINISELNKNYNNNNIKNIYNSIKNIYNNITKI